MKIQLKRSNVLSGDAAKEPTATQMEYGELAVNYSNGDPAIFLKDSTNKVIRIAGKGATGLDGDYVNITGDNMTGDLTLGTDKITLDANDGSATFAGQVRSEAENSASFVSDKTVGYHFYAADVNSVKFTVDAAGSGSFASAVTSVGDPTNGATNGTRLGSTVQCANGGGPVWAGYTVGNSTATSTIDNTGSANFGNSSIDAKLAVAGVYNQTGLSVSAGGTGYSNCAEFYNSSNVLAASIGGDGSATFASSITIPDVGYRSSKGVKLFNTGIVQAVGTDTSNVWMGFNTSDGANGASTSQILADGSAIFLGDCVVGENTTGAIGVNKGAVYSGKEGYLSLFQQSSLTVPYLTCNRNGVSDPLAVINGDGSATFAGQVTTGALRAFDANETARIKSSRTSGDLLTLWGGATSINDGTKVVSFEADGSASFDGVVKSVDSNNSNKWSALNNGYIVIQDPDANSDSIYLRCRTTNGDNKVEIKGDGSADFAGSVESNGYLYAKGSGSYLVVERTGATGTTTVAEFGGDTSTITFTANGSATFQGNVIAGGSSTGYGISGQNGAAFGNLWQAAVSGQNSVAGGPVWAGLTHDFTASNSKVTSSIFEDGSATFAGDVNVGDFNSTTGSGILLYDTGEIRGKVASGSVGGVQLLKLQRGSEEQVVFFADGSAVFSDSVTSKKVLSNSNSVLFRGQSDFGQAANSLVDKFVVKADGSANFGSDNFYTGANGSSINTNVQVTGDSTSAKLTLNSPGNCTYSLSANKTDGSNGDFVIRSESAARNDLVISNGSGNASFASTVTANAFVGDGSGLTNLPGGGTLQTVTDAGNTTTNTAYFSNGLTVWKSPNNTALTLETSVSNTNTAFLSGKSGTNIIGALGTTEFVIYSNGSASFNGTVTAKNALKAENSSRMDGAITAYNSDSSANAPALQVLETSNFEGVPPVVTSYLTNSGSAHFSRNVSVGNGMGSQLNAIALSVANSSSQSPTIFARNINNGPLLQFQNAGGLTITSIDAGGNAVFNGTVTANGSVLTSDARFKENITPAKPQLADVVALGGLLKNYDWNEDSLVNDELRSVRQLGLIAQEAAEVCPAIVKDIKRTKTVEVTPAVTGPKGKVLKEAVTKEEEDSYKGISQDALIMKLIGAVAELSAEVEALKAAK